MSKQARMEKARARASRVSRSWAEDHNRNHCSLENTVATANGGSGPQAAWRLPSTDDDEDQLDLGLGDCAFALCIEEPSCEGGWIGCGDASSASSAHAHYNVANPRATCKPAAAPCPTDCGACSGEIAGWLAPCSLCHVSCGEDPLTHTCSQLSRLLSRSRHTGHHAPRNGRRWTGSRASGLPQRPQRHPARSTKRRIPACSDLIGIRIHMC